MEMTAKISEKSLAILKCIARGHSYEQILAAYPEITYLDIFNAAQEAVQANEQSQEEHIAKIRKRHPRAYEKWTDEEDEQLAQLFRQGVRPEAIAQKLQRQSVAIYSRLRKQGLMRA
jgi:Myb-like DNA-binding domain